MKKLAWVLGVLGTGSVAGVSVAAKGYEPVAAPGTTVGMVEIGGLTKEAAAKKIRVWWEQEKTREITLRLVEANKTIAGRPGKLGVTVDDTGSIEKVDFRDFWESAKAILDKGDENAKFPIKFKAASTAAPELAEFVENNVAAPRPARVYMSGTKIERIPEISGRELDSDRLGDAVIEALNGDGTADIPVREAKKTVSDEDLAQISEVRSEFTTKFSEGKASRSANIRNAAKRIDGLVLAPGQRFSFNKVVGKRGPDTGFQVAGVYKNGRHDVDFGGGICQVSTTLYNAALVADLKIPARRNHSMPVPYVPLGRDAAVDYNGVDLVIENNLETPIALSSSVSRGQITFRVLGKRDPSLSIKIVTGGAKSWSAGEQTIKDPSLPAGRTKVIEKGSSGHSINSWRVVYRDGVEVRRDPLGQSYYRGGKRIIAVGTAAPKPSELAPEIDPMAPPTLPDESDGL
jgi:vancomycin resistance protein YoaR